MIVKKANWLRDLFVKEISVVDRPANPGATILLKKRDDDPSDGASDVQLLLRSMHSILAEGALTKQEKNALLRETLKQYAEVTGRDGLRDIEAIEKKPRTAPPDPNAPGRSGFGPIFADTSESELKETPEEKKRRLANAKAKENEMKKIELLDVAKRVVAGHDTKTTRTELYDAARKLATADRQFNETIEKALGRFWETPAGGEIYKAMKIAPADDVAATAEDHRGPAMRALHKRADEIRAETGMSREQAVSKMATDPWESALWKAARIEESERISVA
jgi:hypothetical protein